MKIKDIKQLLPIKIDEIEVNPASIIEHHFFNKAQTHGKSYRQEALDFMIKNNISFANTNNTAFEMLRLLTLKCPKCHRNMIHINGSGNSSFHTAHLQCPKCKTEGHISIPSEDGISFTFRDK